MRIIAGKYKKTPLKTLDSLDTRPTKDMVKEALFSTIYNLENCHFLDLFAGSGAIGIEALSRGAKQVVFNDLNPKATLIIKENLKHIHEVATVFNLNYIECLSRLQGNCFDYIFLDPPYAFKEYEKVLELIKQYQLLSLNGMIIIEVHKDVDLKEAIFDYRKIKERKYGISKLLYYEKEND